MNQQSLRSTMLLQHHTPYTIHIAEECLHYSGAAHGDHALTLLAANCTGPCNVWIDRSIPLTKPRVDNAKENTSVLEMNINVSSEHLLMTALMRKYDSSIRPVYNSSKTVQVLLGLTLTQILDLIRLFVK
ncbi:hypothetical protein CHS0354_011789 [Potamilus streckersoni]|uniref:Uncharacterized protein n=1 Tax=Potamilus streckersoni TaxID=2493646 RepID=A0AAE0TGR9_9BIVA|nr:hypothetical protein CHS0354_011789 [Potamilus streckersoni]